MKLSFKVNKTLQLHKVKLGKTIVSIPVAMFDFDKDKTIIITAGIDGDEYAGIAAAYQLIDFFSKNICVFNLIIIPVVNTPGFFAGTSFNPLDNKLLKLIFPGNATGSESEQLINWLSNYVNKSCLWIDLHSGNTQELLQPFIWTWLTKNEQVDDIVRLLLRYNRSNTQIYERYSTAKIKALAKQNIPYIMLESGQAGKVEKKAVKQHDDWVKEIILAMGQNNRQSTIEVYRSVLEIRATQSGRWEFNKFPKIVQKGDRVGTITTLDNKVYHVIARQSGVVLYAKYGFACQKGETVLAMASVLEKI